MILIRGDIMTQICFFTSSMMTTEFKEDGTEYAVPIKNDNHFLTRLSKAWPENAKVLMISSRPTTYENNDLYLNMYRESMEQSNLSIEKMHVYDYRNDFDIHEYDVLILSGGHVPTQNHFFEEINLKNKIHDFHGVIVSLSAGSMNAADIVYSLPEERGEAEDPNYKRYFEGLGLYDKRIFPHFQYFNGMTLDGLDMVHDIALKDSYNEDIYAIDDGVYFLKQDGKLYLCGKAVHMKDGQMTDVGADDSMTEMS